MLCLFPDPSGAIIVVKFLCKNSDFITMLRVGTRDSTDTLRARIKKKLDDVHNYDIYLPSLVRMAEDTCLEDHHVKERVRFAGLALSFHHQLDAAIPWLNAGSAGAAQEARPCGA